MAAPHPDYLAVAEERRWGRPLNELFGVLQKEAWKLKGGWAWRVLPHGALVSVRIVPPEAGQESAFHLELRIARKDAPADATGWQRWAQELATFLKHLGGGEGDWQSTANLQASGKADATFRFRMRGEPTSTPAPAPQPVCTRCGKGPVIDPGLFAVDLCRVCATELAAEDVRRNEAARAKP